MGQGRVTVLLLLWLVWVPGCLRGGFDRQVQDAAGDGPGSPDLRGPGPDRARADASGDLAGADEGSAGDLTLPDAPWSSYKIHSFKSYWNTPHTMTWIWQCSGTLAGFDHYELCWGSSLAQALAGTSCLGASDSFSLHYFECKGPPWWRLVSVYDRSPQQTYYVQLRVKDNKGTEFLWLPDSTQTPAVPVTQEVIFSESVPAGMTLTNLFLSSTNPHSGSYGLLVVIPDTQWYTLEIAFGSLSLIGITEERFKKGYLELFLDAPEAAMVCVVLKSAGDDMEYCPTYGYAAPDAKNGYQRIQVPLRQFLAKSSGLAMTLSQLTQVTAVQAGAKWGPGTVYLDDVNVWY